MAVRLFVGNLPYDATEDEIRQHFSSVGNLSYVSIPLDRETGKKRGFAFVEFADPQQAQEAIRQFNAYVAGFRLLLERQLAEVDGLQAAARVVVPTRPPSLSEIEVGAGETG